MTSTALTAFKFKPNEFIVEEIACDGTILEAGARIDLGKPEDEAFERDYFTRFVLEKSGWNTMQAIQAIARALRVKPKRFSFAGTKDRNAVSVQLCSAFAVPPQRLLGVRVKDLRINGAWKARDKIRLGDLAGNRFTITLSKENCGRDVSASDLLEKARAANFLFPNYFGAQRFGVLRENTALVGELLLRGKFKDAALNYLTFISEKEDAGATKARKRLAREKDFGAAFNYFPTYLKYELLLLEHLKVHENDFVGALSKLPRGLQLMFIHALQSRLFNELLEARVKRGALLEPRKNDWWCEANAQGFPDTENAKQVKTRKEARKVSELVEEGRAFLVGNVVGSETALSREEKALLKKHGLAQKNFEFKSMPWLSTRGGKRALFVALKDFRVLSESPPIIRFSLPAGSYATTALSFLLEGS